MNFHINLAIVFVLVFQFFLAPQSFSDWRSDIEELYNSIYKKLLVLPNNLRIYPGHHYGKKASIQIIDNISISPLLRAKNLQDFIERMQNYERNRLPNT